MTILLFWILQSRTASRSTLAYHRSRTAVWVRLFFLFITQNNTDGHHAVVYDTIIVTAAKETAAVDTRIAT